MAARCQQRDSIAGAIHAALAGWIRLVIASNERGLKLASPKQGMVTLERMIWRSSSPRNRTADDGAPNATPDQKFGPGWFWPALKRYRGVLIQVLAASFVVQLFTLANPLLIQVIIDKVISQRSLDTLQVLGIALVVVTILEGAGQRDVPVRRNHQPN